MVLSFRFSLDRGGVFMYDSKWKFYRFRNVAAAPTGANKYGNVEVKL